MAQKKRYVFNADTLAYELKQRPLLRRVAMGSLFFLLSVIIFVLYYLLFTEVLGYETPRTKLLKQRADWLISKTEIVKAMMADSWKDLEVLQSRDNNVYRPVFGMEPISPEERNKPYTEVTNYADLMGYDYSNSMIENEMAMDLLYKKAYTQSLSFDTLSPIAMRASLMTTCVPAIPPVYLNHVHLSSRFGVRTDPMSGNYKVHEGIDLSGSKGEPVYVTGDGVVEAVNYNFFGYGNMIIVDHGFGYKTRYAHLQSALVRVGDHVRRGDKIATMGSTGKSTGPHLHYEVQYMGRKMNPLNFFNMNTTEEEYNRLVNSK